MSEVKVSSIKSQELYPILVSKGFTKAKNCGPGNSGYIKILGLHLVESLILRQNENMNNLGFILEQIDKLQAQARFPRIFQVLMNIQEKITEDHNNFVSSVKNDPTLMEEILSFSLNIYRIDSSTTDYNKITESLKNASTNLNIQFFFYSETMLLYEISLNRYISPIVLNFYYNQKPPEIFYMLYHSDYQTIQETSLNTSSLFNLSLRDPYNESELSAIINFINRAVSLNLNQDQKNYLKSIIQELKEIDSIGYSLESYISN